MLVELMRESIEAFVAEGVGLSKLVSDLESVIDSLAEVADSRWVEELRSVWWRLEFINAMAIDEGRPVPTADEHREIDDALGELRAALVAY